MLLNNKNRFFKAFLPHVSSNFIAKLRIFRPLNSQVVKHLLLAIACLLLHTQGRSQLADFSLSIKHQYTNFCSLFKSIEESPRGTIFIASQYCSETDFDLDPQNQVLLGPDDDRAIFLAKYDPTLNLKWVLNVSGGINSVSDIVSDKNDNVYITGNFSDSIDLDPNIPGANHFAMQTNGFVAKYDSLGNYVSSFIYDVGSPWPVGSVHGAEIELIDDKWLVVSSILTGEIDVDPSTVGYYSVSGDRSLFVALYDTNYQLQWAKSFDGTVISRNLQVDEQGNILLAGEYRDSIMIDPSGTAAPEISLGGSDIFIASFDRFGQHQWSKSYGGPGKEILGSLEVDLSGEILISISFQDSISIDNGQQLVVSAGHSDSFISKQSKTGQEKWVRHFKGTSIGTSQSIAAQPDGSFLTVGLFAGEFDLDPTVNNQFIYSGSNTTSGAFITHFANDGLLVDGFNLDLYDWLAEPDLSILSDGSMIFSFAIHGRINLDPWIIDTLPQDTADFAYYNNCRNYAQYVHTICTGDSLFLGGSYHSEDTVVTNVFQNQLGCDSVVVDQIFVQRDSFYYNHLLPLGDTVFFAGNAITTCGNYVHVFSSSSGCDSVVTLNVHHFWNDRPKISKFPSMICLSDSVVALPVGYPNGGVFSGAGVTLQGVEVVSLSPGPYYLYYTVPATACLSDTIDSVLFQVADTTITSNMTFFPDQLCLNGFTQKLPSGKPIGGAFSGPGITGNGVDPQKTGTGRFPIYYTFSQATCVQADTLYYNVSSVETQINFFQDTICDTAAIVPFPNATPAGGIFEGFGVTSQGIDPQQTGPGNFYFTYLLPDSQCVVADTAFYTVDSCYSSNTGIEKIVSHRTSIYPNPNQGSFQISIRGNYRGSKNIIVLNNIGQVIHFEKLSQEQDNLELFGISTGVYSVVCTWDDFAESVKIVVLE